MATLNQCSFIGRLGKDPEMNYTPNGKAVTKFSLAVDQGKGQDTLWLTIVCWNELAERMHEYLSKGQLVFVQGRLVQRLRTLPKLRRSMRRLCPHRRARSWDLCRPVPALREAT